MFLIGDCCGTIDCLSQSWLPLGATWYTGIVESFFSINQGYIVSSVLGDSIILTKNARVIKSVRHRSYNPIAIIDTMYIYDDGGKIYHFTNGQFYKLYDYNLMPGDTWQVSVAFPSPFASPPTTTADTIVTIIVDSVGTLNINGQIRKTQYVRSKNNDWYFLNPIIEGIGSSGGFFPFLYDWQDSDIPFLRCYTDSLFFYQANINFPCDTFINGISVNEFSELEVFPNPATDLLKITFLNYQPQSLIIILDSHGRECLRRKTYSGESVISLDVHQLVPGFYYCLIINKSFNRTIKIIKF